MLDGKKSAKQRKNARKCCVDGPILRQRLYYLSEQLIPLAAGSKGILLTQIN